MITRLFACFALLLPFAAHAQPFSPSGTSGAPLQKPGALLITRSGGFLIERDFEDPAQLRSWPGSPHGPIAFAPNGTLFVFDHPTDRVMRYDPGLVAFVAHAQGLPGDGSIASLDDRLIGGQPYECGRYWTASHATGNLFFSAMPDPCDSDWSVVRRRNEHLIVLQGSRITRRHVSAPGTVVQSIPFNGYPSDAALTSDGGLWVLLGSSLLRVAPNGTLLRTYPLTGWGHRIALREDGLLAVVRGDNAIGFVQPEHGYASWRSGGDYYDFAAFVPGVLPDQDADGLPLWFEQAYQFDPADPSDAALDADGDTLSNAQEFAFRSRPRDPDSDDDGASDALEHAAQSDPQLSDTDGDGLSDGLELVDLQSNPRSTDSDGDGMGDQYEYTHNLLLTQDDRSADPDGDGLGNLDEFQRGTAPNVADSDLDGLNDGAEVSTHATDPLDRDSDDDGLDDGPEVVTHGTDPNAADSDEDGLDDRLELQTLLSNPLSVDSDGDAMPDGWEHAHGLKVTVADAGADADLDGLANHAEYVAGTDPQHADSDRDQLIDGNEIAIGTDPLDPDTDADLLPDGWEFGSGRAPLVADAHLDGDADSFSALEEYWSGSFDTDAASHPQPLAWNTHQGDQRHRGYQPLAFGPLGGTALLRTLSLQGVAGVVAADGKLLVSFSSYFGLNALVAYDAATGAEVWRKDFGAIFSTTPPAYAQGVVYVQSGNHGSDSWLRAYRVGDGGEVFRAPFAAQWEHYLAPTVYGDYVYVNGGYYGGAYAFHRVSGARQWFVDLPQVDEWTPAVDDAHVYAFTGSRLDVIARSSGAIEYTLPISASGTYSVRSAPILGGYGNALLCSGDLTSVDLAAREVAWTRPGCSHSRHAAGNGVVYMTTYSGLTAVNELTGAVLWERAFALPLAGNLVVSRQYLIVSDVQATHFLRLSDQQVVHSLPVSGDKVLTDDGRLLVSGTQGVSIYRLPVRDTSQDVFFDSFE